MSIQVIKSDLCSLYVSHPLPLLSLFEPHLKIHFSLCLDHPWDGDYHLQ